MKVFKTLTNFKQTNCFIEDVNSFVDLIIHMTPFEIATTPEYQSWMKSIGCKRTRHLIMNNRSDSNPSPTVFTFDKIYEELSKDYPQVFPALQYSCIDMSVQDIFGLPNTVKTTSPSLKYVFRPQRLKGFDESLLRSKMESLLKQVKNEKNGQIFTSSEQDNDFEVVFLGTGSRVSSVLRNTSGILLHLR